MASPPSTPARQPGPPPGMGSSPSTSPRYPPAHTSPRFVDPHEYEDQDDTPRRRQATDERTLVSTYHDALSAPQAPPRSSSSPSPSPSRTPPTADVEREADPRYDDLPDHRLRLCRTATSTIHECISEDDRRRKLKKERMKNRGSALKRRFTLGKDGSSSSSVTPTGRKRGLTASSAEGSGSLKSPSKKTAFRLSAFTHPHDAPTLRPSTSQSSLSGAATAKRSTSIYLPPMPRVEETAEDEHTTNLRELEDSPAADIHLNQNRRSVASSRKRSLFNPINWFRARPRGPKKGGKDGLGRKGVKGGRRSVYVNLEMPLGELDEKGEPRKRFPRNKVRTTKYTIVTFLPKNLTLQFKNVANVYFLALVVLQVFPIFGATTPQIAMLPLVFILSVTALKDGFEDYRRYVIDNSVNNSPCTRLGDWRNVNVPEGGGGSWWENLDWPWEGDEGGLPSVHDAAAGTMYGGRGKRRRRKGKKVSRGVKKLREREKETFNTDFLYSTAGNRSRAKSTGTGMETETEERLSEIDSIDVLGRTPPQPGATSTEGSQESSPELGFKKPLSQTRVVGRGRADSDTSRFSRNESSPHIIDYSIPTPGTAKWERTLWKKLEVGDVVLLREDEAIPADLIVLSTSDPEGQCFVETKNLDGETNLKPRRAVKSTRGIANEEDLEHARFVVDSEAPHANLYAYQGTLRYWTKDEPEGKEHPVQEGRVLRKGQEKKEPVGVNEILLRGCTLRNTQWVLGLVMFTGRDTKIMLNQGDTPSKRPRIAEETNYNVIANFIILSGLCIGTAVGDLVNQLSHSTSAYSFEPNVRIGNSAILDALVVLGAALILFQSIVPISLVITLELVRTIQAFFILQDLDMYYSPLDQPCIPKSWNLSDDLGQIEYVFSDKTGTLTQNVMEFQKCSVNGVTYGEGVTEAMLGAAKREGRDTSALDPAQNADSLREAKETMIKTMKSSFEHRYLDDEALTLISPKLAKDLAGQSNPQRERLIAFWRALALCHDVLASRDDHDPFTIDYKAESPDEAALVAAARDVGFVFVGRTHAQLEIEVLGQTEYYTPIRTLAFNSSRKRMSVIVRCPDGRIKLICKGADSIIFARLRSDADPQLKASTTKDLESFANAGLRTLLVSERELTEQELADFLRDHDAASGAIQNRDDEMEKVADRIERELTILGATALEDKLQVGVPDAIEQLHQAGIKIWVLTGDKLQTAIEIGFSCNLLTNDMDIMIISSDGESGARSQIEQGIEKIRMMTADGGSNQEKSGGSAPRPAGGFAVVIDGDTLRYALDSSLKHRFLALTVQCEAVVCCRVSPAQKALVVKLVKDGCKAMTLAIGDGANDVSMIQEANIGVGIAGLEGAQASMSADYAIGQFRFLTKLLLVHGRWCYIRVADMHTGFFFKNGVFTFTLFWYQLYCSWNVTFLYDYTFIMLFNLVFTSLPVAALGIFEQDVSAKASIAFPGLYKHGIMGAEYTRWTFWFAMLDSVYESCVCFWIPYFVYYTTPTASVQGHDVSIWEFGITIVVGAVFVANNFIGILTRYWTWIIVVVSIVSSLSVLVWTMIYSLFPTFTFHGVMVNTFGTFEFWASVVLVQILALLPRFVWRYVQVQYRPIDSDIVREIVLRPPSDKTHEFLEAMTPNPLKAAPATRSPNRSKVASPARSPRPAQGESHEMTVKTSGVPLAPIIAVSESSPVPARVRDFDSDSSAATSSQPSPIRAPASSPFKPHHAPRSRSRTITNESLTSQDALNRRSAGTSPIPSPTYSSHDDPFGHQSRPTSTGSEAQDVVSPSPSWATALEDSTFNRSRVH